MCLGIARAISISEGREEFLRELLDFARENKRDMPWRHVDADDTIDPYVVLVSEIMLQQTQVPRVLPKFQEFMEAFPSVERLAAATLPDVFAVWNGLGYNRRARYLLEAAQQLAGKTFPKTLEQLTALKGIGHNTAAAILTYSFNQRQVFVETNIRTVLLHHFFAGKTEPVHDGELRTLLEGLLLDQSPREFYWAMMDYGTHLKKLGHTHGSKSKHHSKQSAFAGSVRQLRGELMRRGLRAELVEVARREIADDRFDSVVAQLESEGLLEVKRGRLSLPNQKAQ